MHTRTVADLVVSRRYNALTCNMADARTTFKIWEAVQYGPLLKGTLIH